MKWFGIENYDNKWIKSERHKKNGKPYLKTPEGLIRPGCFAYHRLSARSVAIVKTGSPGIKSYLALKCSIGQKAKRRFHSLIKHSVLCPLPNDFSKPDGIWSWSIRTSCLILGRVR